MYRTIRLIAIFNFLTDFSLLAPFAIIYFSKVSGSFTLGMSILAITMFSSAIFEVPTGIFSDWIGRKPTIVVGAAVGIVSALCYAIGGQYWWLVVGAVDEGLARAFFSGNNDAYLHDILHNAHRENDYRHFLGKVSAMFQIALAISALCSGAVTMISLTLVAWLDVIPATLRLIISFAMVGTPKQSHQSSNIFTDLGKSIKLIIQKPQLRWLSLANVLDYAISETSYQFRSAFVATLWPFWAIGVAKLLSNVGAALSFWESGRIIKKYREQTILVVSAIYGKVVNVIALFFPGIGSPALLASTSLFYGVSEVASNHLRQKEFSETQRATLGSLTALGGSILFGFMALLLGKVADLLSPAGGLLLFQLFSLVPLVIYLHLFHITRRSHS